MSFYPCGPAAGKLIGDEEVRTLAGEQAGDELFGLPPEEFVAARDDLVRRLKRDGDAEAAARVKALRRPPLSAWAVNRLARERAAAVDRLLAAGERLRAAHQAALAGEGAAELRAAAKAEREAVADLVRTALELLGEAGHPTTDATRDRVAASLHAAAASPEAAELVRHGRLTADLAPAGFDVVADDLDEAAEARPRAARRGRAADAGGRAAKGRAAGDGDGVAAAADDRAARRARRAAAVAARDEARKRARLAADQAVLATRQAERLGRLADQAEREAGRARSTAAAAIEAASAARERAARAATALREAEDRIPADR
jgi:hypothetical protein